MNVLSLCDGMSCGQIALKELNIPIDNYYASEIDKNAIKVTQDNFPNTIQLGDVTKITEDILNTLPKIDLVIFGSPCRSLTKTTAGREQYNNGLKGISGLFYTCNDILQYIKKNNNSDVFFLVENVDSYNKSDLQTMNDLLSVAGTIINSSLFSAQERIRYYWTNIPLKELPNPCKDVINDIRDSEVADKYYYDKTFTFYGEDKRVCATLDIKGHDIIKRVYSIYAKAPTLTACRGGNRQVKIYDNGKCRNLTPHEYRKLQTIPEWYKMDVADSHIYNMCGDGWNIETIKYLFSYFTSSDNDKHMYKKVTQTKKLF